MLHPPQWRPCIAGPLPGLPNAAEITADAIQKGRRIAVFGDFDADGLTATALLTRCLRQLGGEAVPFLPSRIEEGYGLSARAAQRCIASLSPELILTVDCGTNARETVRAIRDAGVEIVISDHHLPAGPPAPASAIVNPYLAGAQEVRTPLAGVGVALEIAVAVAQCLGRAVSTDELNALLELAAIGTIADCMPLRGVNRTIVKAGLIALNRTLSPGLRALIEDAGLSSVRRTWDVAFVLAPRLNAAGRLGTADTALELLLTTDRNRAVELARQLGEANRRRQNIERRLLDEISRQLERDGPPDRHAGLVVAGKGWHVGVIGIVASKLATRYGRPVAVISIGHAGPARGSVRGVEGVDLASALLDCAGLLVCYGGHATAVGFEIEPDRLPEFAVAFNGAVGRQLKGRRPDPPLHLDAPIQLQEISTEVLDWIDRLGPYGFGFPPPLWGMQGAQVVDWHIVNGCHVQMKLRQGARHCSAIAFQQAERPRPCGPVDIAFELNHAEWRGKRRVDLHVVDWRETPAAR